MAVGTSCLTGTYFWWHGKMGLGRVSTLGRVESTFESIFVGLKPTRESLVVLYFSALALSCCVVLAEHKTVLVCTKAIVYLSMSFMHPLLGEGAREFCRLQRCSLGHMLPDMRFWSNAPVLLSMQVSVRSLPMGQPESPSASIQLCGTEFVVWLVLSGY